MYFLPLYLPCEQSPSVVTHEISSCRLCPCSSSIIESPSMHISVASTERERTIFYTTRESRNNLTQVRPRHSSVKNCTKKCSCVGYYRIDIEEHKCFSSYSISLQSHLLNVDAISVAHSIPINCVILRLFQCKILNLPTKQKTIDKEASFLRRYEPTFWSPVDPQPFVPCTRGMVESSLAIEEIRSPLALKRIIARCRTGGLDKHDLFPLL